MLTNKMKSVLDKSIQLYTDNNGPFCIEHSSNIFTPIPFNEVPLFLKQLDSDGYIKYRPYKDGSCSVNLTAKGLEYKSLEQSITTSTQTNIFNGPVSNSAIGNTGTITINNGISIQEALSYIQSLDIPQSDKAEAKEVVTYIETLAENEVPLKKGILSKFSDVLAKHSWLPELVAKLAFAYLTGESL